jgi:pSer/pThr/pTyr-binding forkhead associated (FHA) protein
MKLSLIVVTPGKWEGKEIPITLSQFLIGRDEKANLRPANPIISKRHCLVTVRDNAVFLRDLGSTNGTYLNGEQLKSERELADKDHISIGPLEFRVQLQASIPVDEPTPVPPPPKPAAHHQDEDTAAAMLFALQDTGFREPETQTAQDGEVASGSTVMDILTPTSETAENKPTKGGASRHDAAKTAQADTSAAAKVILDKYLRRPRN